MKHVPRIHSVSLDDNEVFFFARELEFIKKQSYDIEYPQLKAFGLIPISTEAGPGAESITYQSFNSTGLAKVISSYADDLPRADVRGQEFTTPVRGIGCSYGYSLQEIRAAQMAGRSLTDRQAAAARLAHDQRVNYLAWFGDPNYNLGGFLTNPDVPATSVSADGTGGNTEWTTKTPDQILRDMNLFANMIPVATLGVEAPNTLLLPIEQYTLVASTPRSPNSDTTILQYFIENNPYVKSVQMVPELAGAGPMGSDIMIAYDYNPRKVTMEIPMPYTQRPPQERVLEFVVPCESRYGGVIFYYPLSANIGEGI